MPCVTGNPCTDEGLMNNLAEQAVQQLSGSVSTGPSGGISVDGDFLRIPRALQRGNRWSIGIAFYRASEIEEALGVSEGGISTIDATFFQNEHSAIARTGNSGSLSPLFPNARPDLRGDTEYDIRKIQNGRYFVVWQQTSYSVGRTRIEERPTDDGPRDFCVPIEDAEYCLEAGGFYFTVEYGCIFEWQGETEHKLTGSADNPTTLTLASPIASEDCGETTERLTSLPEGWTAEGTTLTIPAGTEGEFEVIQAIVFPRYIGRPAERRTHTVTITIPEIDTDDDDDDDNETDTGEETSRGEDTTQPGAAGSAGLPPGDITGETEGGDDPEGENPPCQEPLLTGPGAASFQLTLLDKVKCLWRADEIIDWEQWLAYYFGILAQWSSQLSFLTLTLNQLLSFLQAARPTDFFLASEVSDYLDGAGQYATYAGIDYLGRLAGASYAERTVLTAVQDVPPETFLDTARTAEAEDWTQEQALASLPPETRTAVEEKLNIFTPENHEQLALHNELHKAERDTQQAYYDRVKTALSGKRTQNSLYAQFNNLNKLLSNRDSLEELAEETNMSNANYKALTEVEEVTLAAPEEEAPQEVRPVLDVPRSTIRLRE